MKEISVFFEILFKLASDSSSYHTTNKMLYNIDTLCTGDTNENTSVSDNSVNKVLFWIGYFMCKGFILTSHNMPASFT